MTNITLAPEAVEDILLTGDLSKLSPQQRVIFYQKTCERVGLDPLAQPFDYLRLNGSLVLYANKRCAEQLRRKHNISIDKPTTEMIGDIYQATVGVTLPDGRTDADIGTVDVKGASGDRLANAMMKAVTKAKRRATLSVMGLGMLDESELETVPGAMRVAKTEAETVDRLEMRHPVQTASKQVVDHDTGQRVTAEYPVHKQPSTSSMEFVEASLEAANAAAEIAEDAETQVVYEELDGDHYAVTGRVSAVRQPDNQKFYVVEIEGFTHEYREDFTTWDETHRMLLDDAMYQNQTVRMKVMRKAKNGKTYHNVKEVSVVTRIDNGVVE